jgi:pyruvate dehydrogenase phosphatase
MASRSRAILRTVRYAAAVGTAVAVTTKVAPTFLERGPPKAVGRAAPNSDGLPTLPPTTSMLVSRAVYPANDPIEDRHDVRELADGVVLAAVLDGHGGWQASEFARRHLLDTVAEELENAAKETAAPGSAPAAPGSRAFYRSVSTDAMSLAMRRAFGIVDASFLTSIRSAFDAGFGNVASVGACTLAAAVLPNAVVVANAGDCRAVLGRTSVGKPPAGARASGPGAWRVAGDGVYYSALPMSRDHNAREEYEKKRLAAEHPGESDIVVCHEKDPKSCYVKGRLQPTRVIGDAYLKDRAFNAPSGMRTWGRHIREPYTPPYVSR